jgi:protoheme IX farnesyltransferase
VANIQLVGRLQEVGERRSRSRVGQILRDLAILTKPRITALVLVTEVAGMCLASGSLSASARADARTRWLSLVGTALIVASANVLNMWLERDVDALMTRTRNRPLPAGRLSPDLALAFGLTLAALSIPMLLLVNLPTCLLGLAALVSYVLVYTPLKRHTYLALLVGAVPGAMPPLLGWSTVTGTVGLGGALLFLFLFLWQLPHFAAITIFRAEDYRRAGLRVVSVEHGERAARHMIALYTALLVATSFSFVPVRLAGLKYEVAATLCGVAFLALALRGTFAGPSLDSKRWAKGVFACSIPYLVITLFVLVVDRLPTQ